MDISFYRLTGSDGDDGGEAPYRIGADFTWSLAWHPDLLSYVAMLYEAPPYMDEEQDPDEPILYYGLLPLEILSVEELEGYLDFELPGDVAEQLRADQARHYAGEAGDSVEEIQERMRAYARGEGPRWRE